MIDYAYMNQCLYEGNHIEVERLTREALAEGRSVDELFMSFMKTAEPVEA